MRQQGCVLIVTVIKKYNFMSHFGTRDVSCLLSVRFILVVSCSINFLFQALAHWTFIIQIDPKHISVDREEKHRK